MQAKSRVSLGSYGSTLCAFVGVTIAAMATPTASFGQADEVTFTKDIAPIFQASCQTCHREGAIAPMSLMTYEESRPWARSIKEKVSTRSMPPWYIDRNIGVQDFKYDRSLNDDQIATIVSWVDAGARQSRRHARRAAVRGS